MTPDLDQDIPAMIAALDPALRAQVLRALRLDGSDGEDGPAMQERFSRALEAARARPAPRPA